MPEFQNINYDFVVMTASVNFENWKIGLKVTDCSNLWNFIFGVFLAELEEYRKKPES
jgi:hypothetical protein